MIAHGGGLAQSISVQEERPFRRGLVVTARTSVGHFRDENGQYVSLPERVIETMEAFGHRNQAVQGTEGIFTVSNAVQTLHSSAGEKVTQLSLLQRKKPCIFNLKIILHQ